jgi:uncharacterized repeat protein (TIGR01451 family)
MTRHSLPRWRAALCLAFVLALLAPWALADTPVSLFQSFAGNVNFTGTEATWRTSGTDQCAVITKKKQTVGKPLSGIPAGATILAAHLYWAGSGSTADYSVTLNGTTINATRQYSGSFVQGATTFSYFGGAADVTSIVKAKGNATYTFGGLTVDNSTAYCQVQGVLGAFALMVIYSEPSQPFRVLNVYEGFQHFQFNSINLALSNFRMPNPLNGASGRLGHITWEGDQSLNQQGENLSFNGNVLTDALNPSGNQFASRSNIDGDTASYGVDFDAYTVGDPIIKAGDTSSTTTYASGQDMVWLNVEVVAVPNVPTVDLQVVMTRTGEPAAGAVVSYAIVPSNNGPSTETGPVVVTNTLPPGMTYSSVSGGAGWTCTLSGQTATCTYSGNVVKNQVLPTITVNATVGASGQYTTFTNTATIAGQLFDNIAPNNTASDTSTYSAAISGNYAFTVGACKAGTAIGVTGSGCTLFTGPYTAGLDRPLYITYLDTGIPSLLNKNHKDTTKTMQFSLTCINPVKNAGISATFAGQTLKLCTPDGQMPTTGDTTSWTGDVNILFPGDQASGVLPSTSAPPVFRYFDVGLLQLNLADTSDKKSTPTASTRFVSAPQSVKFVTIQNNAKGLNPTTSNVAFARAGDPFSVGVQVLTAPNGSIPASFPPNFGMGTAPYGPVRIALAQLAGTTPVSATFGTPAGGVFTGNVTYDDLGSIQLTATIAGQDASYPVGTYFGVPVTTDTKTVGYFYPAYFQTVASGAMLCLAPMNCPSGPTSNGDDRQVAGAVYSSQPVPVAVHAFTASGKEVTDAVASIPLFSIALNPYDNPGAIGMPATIANITGNSVASTVSGLSASPALSLSNPFFNTAPRGVAWQAPTSAYMRASANFTRPALVNGAQATATDTVTSNRGTGLISKEGGVRVVHGRLLVANAFGSELLKLPLHVYAQYWDGTAWNNNPNDGDSFIPFSNSYDPNGAFTNCLPKLATGAAPPANCKSAVSFLPAIGGSVTLDSGQAIVWMAPPGAGNNGKAEVVITTSPPWLPSTRGQAVFGVYKSPLIYIREVY